jgi:methionine synthase II (cobalamin-independent)
VKIKKIIEKQIEISLKDVIDGEYPHAYWHFDFLEGLLGCKKIQVEHGLQFQGIETKPERIVVEGKIQYNPNHPFYAQFEYLKSVTPAGVIPKVCIPGPSILFEHSLDGIAPEFYKGNKEGFLSDAAEAYKLAIKHFYDLGFRYFQIDDTRWTTFVHLIIHSKTEDEKKFHLSKAADNLWVLNKLLEGKPDDLPVSLHTCRGNYQSHYMSEGAYDSVVDYLAQVNVDGFFLEYDDERSGGFEPLAKIYKAKPNRKVVLGIVTSKRPALESEESLIARINEAAKFIPLENLCLSAQCGFASVEEGNKLTEEEQWAKVKLIINVAKKVWKDA